MKKQFALAPHHREKETKMQSKVMTTIFALVLALTLSVGAASVFAKDLHVTKECSQFAGAAGDFCTITSSNLAAIKKGSKVFYDQAAGIPNCSKSSSPCPVSGMLDSNVVLYVGTGDWAVGRCTLDLGTGSGLCTFSDGIGQLTGFQARVDVSYTGGVNYRWDGEYSFGEQQ
jgi:hypothetical protein